MTSVETQHGVVVGVDGSASSKAAVEWGARDAWLRGLILRLVTVVTPAPRTNPSPWAGVPVWSDGERISHDLVTARQVLEDAQSRAIKAVRPDRSSPIFASVLVGPVVSTLASFAANAAMLVVGCGDRKAFARRLFGTVSSDLGDHVHCPLGIVHDDDSLVARSATAPVAVGIDRSHTSGLAIEIAFDEASRRGVDLIVLHAWNDEGLLRFGRSTHAPIEHANFRAHEEELLDAQLDPWRPRYPKVTVHPVVVTDHPVPRLLQLAETAQLLVLGGNAHRRFASALHGSVSSAVVADAPIPVIVAHGHSVN